MKRFRFRLQRLLDLSHRREEIARRAAGACLRALHEAESALTMGRSERARADAEIARLHAIGAITPRDMLLHHAHLRALDAKLIAMRSSVDDARKSFEVAQREHIDTKRSVILYERSRETRREEWREATSKEEAVAMEETASLRFLRKTRLAAAMRGDGSK